MSNARSSREEFAISLISLALVRNGYQTEKEVRFGQNLVVDLVARKTSGKDEAQDVFAVEVKWVSSLEHGATNDAMQCRDEKSKRIGMALYLALVKGDGSAIKVDSELKEKMLYSDDELEVSTFEAPRALGSQSAD